MPTADAGRTIYAVLPPLLTERLIESKEGFSAFLKNAADRLLADPGYLESVNAKADELEAIVFDDESPSWGVWPLWLDRDGIEMCGAIGLVIGCRLRSALADYGYAVGSSMDSPEELVRNTIESLIESKAAAADEGR